MGVLSIPAIIQATSKTLSARTGRSALLARLGISGTVDHGPHDVDHRVALTFALGRVDHRDRVAEIIFVDLDDAGVSLTF
jgi:hypothetical protein